MESVHGSMWVFGVPAGGAVWVVKGSYWTPTRVAGHGALGWVLVCAMWTAVAAQCAVSVAWFWDHELCVRGNQLTQK